jgi:2-iminobutanoate/2-iminopropanoate deaminase
VTRREVVRTTEAPQALGPYSQAIVTESLIFVSGQIPLDPASGTPVPGGIAEQTDRVIQNLQAILRAAGSDLARTVRTTVFLKDINHFQEMNRVYAEYFATDPPARSTVEVARLPKDVLIEMDVIALR